MTDVFSEEYWSEQFNITQDDLQRITERLERESAPQDLKSIALRIIRGRLEHGHDLSPAVLSELTGKSSVRLWDPAGDWKVGDVVLVARHSGNDQDGDPIHSAYLAEVMEIRVGLALIKIEHVGSIKYSLASPGSLNAVQWHETVREVVEKKLQSDDLEQQAEGILLRYGERILSHLAETLHSDSRLTEFEGKWFPTKKLPRLDDADLKLMHRTALQQPSLTLDELMAQVKKNVSIDETFLRVAIQATLEGAPHRFEKTGTSAQPQWKARLPEPSQAEVTHFAYDPQTYEILCRPGQRLTQKNAQRLQELNLYPHVVTFAE